MKTIGLIGGMSWESTITYYQLLNEMAKNRLGGLHSAKLILYSVEFAEMEALQASGHWQEAGEVLAQAARSLERAGAECIVLCTNTMHKVAPQITAATHLPFLHIAEALAEELNRFSVKKVGLLGTRYTMGERFYTDILNTAGIEVLVPDEEDMQVVNNIIFNELCCGQVREESRKAYQAIIEKLVAQGAEGIVLGCTEIGLLISQRDVPALPVFDTTQLHAKKAFDFALEN
ncbi:MAG: aspartate/glutamate racemase family protein [Anaerolineaceae bacterium]|nr:aspartate/glutamate racemase family protein [Anaerolineaceae bacterium]